MKMMNIKYGRLMSDKDAHEISNFHYFPEKSRKDQAKECNNTSKKSLKNSKSRTRYAEYDEKDETIDDQI
jgi:cytochrome c